ncbi:MAG TPA: ATP-binding protein [Gemmatimonadales bacterium]|nr:ATP-binding protein [Gemmatimonadales bacterium]
MTESFRDLVLGAFNPGRGLTEPVPAHRSFDDVILPPATRHALAHALSLIQHHDLIFKRWGLGERHETGQGLAFHFAGPPGTGKTICAEALADALGRELLVVRYSEMESMWAGQTAKHVAEVFRSAAKQEAVLFFDEADAIAGRRFSEVSRGYEREANAVVNVLLHELERFPGVVIFATNLAQNLDPAFERRILTHIRFERPGPEEREAIWAVQLHPTRTPLAPDVDFAALATRYEATGGEIRNAVLKAAQMAAAEPGPDAAKQIHQRHFEQGITEVLAAAEVMKQSLYEDRPGPVMPPVLEAMRLRLEAMERAWVWVARAAVAALVLALVLLVIMLVR